VGKDSGARAGNAHALELLAILLAREPSAPAEWTQLVIETHRRVLGNASASIAFDSLFSEILARNA
jgi:hypothetical protein